MLNRTDPAPRKAAAPLGLALSVAVLVTAPAFAQSPGPFTVTETGASFHRLQDAVDSIAGGGGTIQISPGTYRDCAVQESGRVAFVAGTRGTVVFDGGICEGKASLVLRGRAAHVEGLTFTHTFVDDGNGAGIRIEKGDLTVVSSIFVDAQSGIVSSNDDRSSTISIDRSTFSGLGKHPDGNGTHSIYVGRYGGIRVTNSRFERGTGGHYLKSRAPRIEVLGSSFDDSRGRDTNYMIDLPEGAVGRIAGNTFVNGADKENYGTMIAVAAESRRQPSAGLTIERNRAWLVPSFPWSTTFVGSWTEEPLVIRDNELGSGIRRFKQR
jgi:hypothetical protein